MTTANGAKRVWHFFATPVGAEAGHRLLVSNALDVTEQKRAEAAAVRRAEQVRRLAEIPARINAATDVASVLGVLTEEARTLIGSHQSVASLTTGEDWGRATSAVSLSDKYAAWREYDPKADSAGFRALVGQSNVPVRLTQAELEAHPAWEGFICEARNRPQLRGWLSVPLSRPDGRSIGFIQLSDRHDGDFTADDEAILYQLALVSAVAYENAKLVQSLRDADRRKDEFLATLAHELRNPLAPLRTGLQVLKVAPANGESAAKAREMMDRQLGHMVRLVDDLLDVSRITRGMVDLKKERIDLRTVVSAALETSRPFVEAARHQLDVTFPSGPFPLDADLTRLAQVFGNLLNNAAKYTPEGGTISLSARADGRQVEIAVRDNGVGIPSEMLPRVFDMFTQVGRSIDRAQGGLGIGLTLVRRLLEMHGGSISAESPGPGRGSTFTVRLPLAADAERPVSQADGNGEPRRPSARRILVVDDNVDGAVSLAMLLRLGGHEVRTVHTGPDAISAHREYRPDVVFLDIGLPGMNGYEVARRVRSESETGRPVLIALTGWGTADDKERAREAGFDHHLTKPVDTSELERVIVRFDTPP